VANPPGSSGMDAVGERRVRHSSGVNVVVEADAEHYAGPGRDNRTEIARRQQRPRRTETAPGQGAAIDLAIGIQAERERERPREGWLARSRDGHVREAAQTGRHPAGLK